MLRVTYRGAFWSWQSGHYNFSPCSNTTTQTMTNPDIQFTPDADPESISSDVAAFGGVLMSTQVPVRADGSLELGDIEAQSTCTLQALKNALEGAGSSMDRVLHLTIYLTDMADRAAFNEVYKRFFKKPWPVRAAVGVAALAVEGMRVEVTAMAAGPSKD
ncbi:RidA family protein [Paraburkholderia bannensis]|nr:RidA family protein [Paraburkholderia bannensis]